MKFHSAPGSDVGLINGCCAFILFNQATRQGRYFRGDETDSLIAELNERTKKLIEGLGLTFDENSVENAPYVCEAIRFMIEEAPISTLEIANKQLEAMGVQQLASMNDLPQPLTDGVADRFFLMELLGHERKMHRRPLGERLRDAINAAINNVDENGTIVAPLMVIPLDADGEPDMDNAHKYAPGTEAYEEIRKQVIEPNRVPGNGTVH